MNAMSRFLLLLLLLVMVVTGCSRSQAPCSVSGKITYKGQPVTGGSIAFLLTLENQHGGYGFTINPDGTYTGSSMPAEEYVVIIETESINKNRPLPVYQPRGNMGVVGGAKIDANTYKKKMQEMGKLPGIKEEQGTYVKVPAKYGGKKTSPLRVKLEKGKNSCDFDLTD